MVLKYQICFLDHPDAWSRPDRKAYWTGIPGDMRGLVSSSVRLVVSARIEITSRDQSKPGPVEQFGGMPGTRMLGGISRQSGFSGNSMGPEFGRGRLASALMREDGPLLAERKRSPGKKNLTDERSIPSP